MDARNGSHGRSASPHARPGWFEHVVHCDASHRPRQCPAGHIAASVSPSLTRPLGSPSRHHTPLLAARGVQVPEGSRSPRVSFLTGLIGDFADRRSLEQRGGSPEASCNRHTNAYVFATRSGNRSAPSIGLVLRPHCIESDEKCSHRRRIEHFGSPFLTVWIWTSPSRVRVHESNTCRSPITIGNA